MEPIIKCRYLQLCNTVHHTTTINMHVESTSLSTKNVHKHARTHTGARARHVSRVTVTISCPSPRHFYSPRFSPWAIWWICSTSASFLTPLTKTFSAASTSRVCS